MGKEKVTTKRGVTTVTNKLGKFERLNVEEMKLLVNHAVQGLAPVSVMEKWGKTILQVEQMNWTPLSAYMEAGMNAETALVFIWNTLRIAYDCERHGLRMDNLCWNPRQIYVDGRGELVMIYWPMVTLEQPPLTPLTFYGGFCQWMQGGYVTPAVNYQYQSYFYQRSYFDFPEFYGMMQDIIAQCQNEKRRHKKREREKYQDGPDRSYQTVCNGWLERPDGEKINLDRSRAVLGRDGSKCEIHIGGFDGVSRTHAVIRNKEGQYYLTDLDSSNGTYICGIRQKPGVEVKLNDGDALRFGNAKFVFRQLTSSATISIHQLNRR